MTKKNVGGSYRLSDGYAETSRKGDTNFISLVVTDALASTWKTRVSLKIEIFGWRYVKDRIATREQLYKRGIVPIERVIYVLSVPPRSRPWTIYSSPTYILKRWGARFLFG